MLTYLSDPIYKITTLKSPLLFLGILVLYLSSDTVEKYNLLYYYFINYILVVYPDRSYNTVCHGHCRTRGVFGRRFEFDGFFCGRPSKST